MARSNPSTWPALQAAGVFLLAVLILFAPAAWAEPQNPNHGRGFAPEKAYQMNEVDHVNLFNGTLNITIPIGPTYQLDGGLSYSLLLSYGSNPWEWDQFCFDSDKAPSGKACQYRAYPTFEDNAGLGWRLHLGRILEPATPPYNSTEHYVYESPDGATHLFYDDLHEGEQAHEAAEEAEEEEKYFYTRDGSYLRMTLAAGKYLIEFPDGTMHNFNGLGELTRIGNRAGSWLTVAYKRSNGRYTQWILRDSLMRRHDIYFTPSNILLNGQPFDPTVLGSDEGPIWAHPASLVRIDRITMASFGADAAKATYDFVYYEDENRTDPEFTAPSKLDSDGLRGPQLEYTLPALVSVDRPDGSAWFIGKNHYNPRGRITRLTYPTGGHVAYEYGTYQFPKVEPFRKKELTNLENPYEENQGVTRRILFNPANKETGRFRYNQLKSDENRTITDVYDPLDHRRKHHFRADPKNSYHGLPMHPTATDGQGRHLSVQVYHSNGTKMRSEYVRYEMDRVYSQDTLVDKAKHYDVNRRVASRSTTFHTDGNRRKTTDMSDFDGLGHYRRVVEGGNFDTATRTRYTRYNRLRGTFHHVNAVPSAYSRWPTNQAWILNTHDQSWVRNEFGTRYGRESCFDGRGYLLRERIQGGAARGQKDVVVSYIRDNRGNVTSETYHGGDTGSVTTGVDACGLGPYVPPYSATYKLNHTYEFGVLAKTKYDGVPWYLLDLTIDKNTGLPESSRDTAELETTYEYDALNRLLWARPQNGHGATTQYVYNLPTGGSGGHGPILNVYRRPNNNDEAILAQQNYFFDGRGRLIKEERRMPGGIWGRRSTEYDGLGNRTATSTWSKFANPAHKTSYAQYDPFGRPGRITPPDGSHHAVTLAYAGVRRVERYSKLGIGGTGTSVTEATIRNTEVYDNLGRLFKFWEDDGVGSRLTTYGYDPADRLSSVVQKGDASTGNRDQTRTFNYDGRGFLWRECHPEKGSSYSSGCVSYQLFDPRGHARRIVDGPQDLDYDYNAAEQLVSVREHGGARRFLQQYDYANQNTNGWSAGKLRSATQHNYFPEFGGLDFPVQETYTYSGRGGRVSHYETRVNTTDVYTQDFTYGDLGNVIYRRFPACDHCNSWTPDRKLRPTYSYGLETSVPGWVSSVTYHANGLDKQVAYTNGVVRTQGNDPHGMARPASISVKKGTQPLYLSGTFRYDGSGNVIGIGNDFYRYDRYGRLLEGSMYQAGFDRRQRYVYDRFNNLKQLTSFTDGVPQTRAFSILAQSNRLSNAAYDGAGNQLTYGAESYHWTPEGRMYRLAGPGKDLFYAYSVSGERVMTYDGLTGKSTFRIRDLSGQVVREFGFNGTGTWTWEKDWIRRSGGRLVGTVARGGVVRFAHADHLGSPRVFSSNTGVSMRQRHFYPFGEQAASVGTDSIAMGFTGHERDENAAGTVDDLDYMHQRYYSPQMGRFLSTDPINSADPKMPRSWNKYVYTMNNPVTFTDPTGLYTCSGSEDECAVVDSGVAAIRQALEGLPEEAEEDRELLQGILDFLGEPGESNGVEITVGKPPVEGALATAGYERRSRGLFRSKQEVIPITINISRLEGRSNSIIRVAGTLTHESSHGIDNLKVGAIVPLSQSMVTEYRANRSEAVVWRGHNTPHPRGLWKPESGYDGTAIAKKALLSVRVRCTAAGGC